MTSPSIEEALAALDAAQECFGQVGWFNVIRSALASAAQEAEAWREIEAWGASNVDILPPDEVANTWDVILRRGSDAPPRLDLVGPTRLAALVAAGEYCRAEREKTR